MQNGMFMHTKNFQSIRLKFLTPSPEIHLPPPNWQRHKKLNINFLQEIESQIKCITVHSHSYVLTLKIKKMQYWCKTKPINRLPYMKVNI